MMRKIAIVVLRGYQLLLRPAFPAACRFHPSCSSYAIEAIARFGVLRGAALAARRLCRCQPFSAGGLDAVPETLS